MILIVGKFPNSNNEKDGMIQRIAAIDDLMKNVDRTYAHISFHRFTSLECHRSGHARIYRLNFFIHFIRLFRLVREAKIVYVHSAYNALKIIPFYPKNKVIFDAHGIVPEELADEGRTLTSWILSLAERTAVRRSSLLVSVTQRMREHFREKYGRKNSNDLIYPIIPNFTINTESRDAILQANRIPRSVIYAGGLHLWQNVDKMIAASAQNPTLSYTFLTSEVVKLRKRLTFAHLPKVICESVPHQAVKNYYLTHKYGYILREPILINAVACPTKLIEYIYWGVLPIVITPRIGDFNEHTLRSISLLDFTAGRLPSEEEESSMRAHNRATLDALIKNAKHAEQRLQSLLTETELL